MPFTAVVATIRFLAAATVGTMTFHLAVRPLRRIIVRHILTTRTAAQKVRAIKLFLLVIMLFM